METAFERLRIAREHAIQGRHEAALSEFIWFHENALAESAALSGVRLSYALHFWMDLGAAYPPALTALFKIREQKVQALLLGNADVSAFRDVVAINDRLGTSSATYELYLQLMQVQAELAASCAKAALPAIVDARDYPLAARLAPDTESAIRRNSAALNLDVRTIKNRPRNNAPERWAYTRNYIESVQRLLTIVSGNGAHQEAARLKKLALALIENPSLRRDVQAGFVRPARAPRPPG